MSFDEYLLCSNKNEWKIRMHLRKSLNNWVWIEWNRTPFSGKRRCEFFKASSHMDTCKRFVCVHISTQLVAWYVYKHLAFSIIKHNIISFQFIWYFYFFSQNQCQIQLIVEIIATMVQHAHKKFWWEETICFIVHILQLDREVYTSVMRISFILLLSHVVVAAGAAVVVFVVVFVVVATNSLLTKCAKTIQNSSYDRDFWLFIKNDARSKKLFCHIIILSVYVTSSCFPYTKSVLKFECVCPANTQTKNKKKKKREEDRTVSFLHIFSERREEIERMYIRLHAQELCSIHWTATAKCFTHDDRQSLLWEKQQTHIHSYTHMFKSLILKVWVVFLLYFVFIILRCSTRFS